MTQKQMTPEMKRQDSLIKKHNEQIAIINATSKIYSISPSTLFYCAAFGIRGIDYVAPTGKVIVFS